MRTYTCAMCCDTGQVLALRTDGYEYGTDCPHLAGGRSPELLAAIRGDVARFQEAHGNILEPNPAEMAAWAGHYVGERTRPSQPPYSEGQSKQWLAAIAQKVNECREKRGEAPFTEAEDWTSFAGAVAPAPSQSETIANAVLRLAARKGYPRFESGDKALDGEESWRSYLRHAPERSLIRAAEWLEGLERTTDYGTTDYPERIAA